MKTNQSSLLHLTSVTEKNLSSRSRRRQGEFRKRQLIEATIDCIDKLGLSQTTLAHISTYAEVSQGNLVFHFQSKDLLLEHTLRHLSEEYMQAWQTTLNTAGDHPVEQLCAMVASPFSARICQRKKISVWYAFWGEARSRPVYRSICGRHDLAFLDTLVKICHRIETSTNATLPAESASVAIEAMTSGLWQNILIGPPGFNRIRGLQEMFRLVEAIYPEHHELIRDQAEKYAK